MAAIQLWQIRNQWHKESPYIDERPKKHTGESILLYLETFSGKVGNFNWEI